ncbi:hypothetical protein E4U43_003870 [Claviceps pusilla]|uniref:Nucleolar protein 14 n=1 Tax=Claviceps pusilla TaxID=123648 RepID=A0A9P7T303_9HYPO|nr:hypothetical protein E4U43_003870 [Claviceps pusilla]
MAGSQLKRLKATLREQGIVGPQQSKKQRRKNAEEGKTRADKRLHRGVVLDGIREQFNPFDLKHAARGPKFEVTSNRVATGDAAKGIRGRPGVTKAMGEERRRETLLVDMQRRNKVGGILDRRFGENDPTMAPEDKMLERFAREKQRSHKKGSLFDLEDDVPMEDLTHMGKTLEFKNDDFEEDDLELGYDSDGSVRERQRLKRLRSLASAGDEEGSENGEPEKKKTKKEVMEEIIAKSKMHKYERQAAKEVDEDLRAELDKELSGIQMLLSSSKGARRADGTDAPPRSAITGVDRDAFERNFDLEVKKLAQDRRAQPTDRTKTEEEKAEEESERLKELENKRQRRMMGEQVTDSEDDKDDDEDDGGRNKGPETTGADHTAVEYDEDDDGFGLGRGIRTRPTAAELGFDDEDDFIIDDDLVASGSDLELVESDEDSEDDDSGDAQSGEDEEEDDFTRGLLNEEESRNPLFRPTTEASNADAPQKSDEHGLPFTFPCPQTHEELRSVTRAYSHENLPTIVQRIRALHHPKLDSKNKERLGNFAVALVDFICSPWDEKSSPPFSVLESLIRHIHSLSKMFPSEIGKRFRHHIEEISHSRPLSLQPCDLILLTAVGTTFPTSDHFHQVVTPAMLTMGRFLGQKVPSTPADYSTGVYLAILSLQYQQLSKRFVPELLNFCLNTLSALSPVASNKELGNFPRHEPPAGLRAQKAAAAAVRKLTLSDCTAKDDATASVKVSILSTVLDVLDSAADLWTGKAAFLETFAQVTSVLKFLTGKSNRSHLPAPVTDKADRLVAKLNRMASLAQISRRSLELHHHRPLAIKTYIPKFEETFDPDKHYDPDRERAELAKLKKEHKKERKGAMRELRKDANFMARENLRVKKAKDEAYEKKFKRLVAEIQSEEGRESNAYEREKKARKRANNK